MNTTRSYGSGLRDGFEIAVEGAEVSEHDGWQRTAPFVEWAHARGVLERKIQAAAADATPRCARHPQAYVWPSATGPRCAICGVLLADEEP